MFKNWSQRSVMAVLLGTLLLQGCQSKLPVFQEEPVSETHTDVGAGKPMVRGVTLATPLTPWSSTLQSSAHATPLSTSVAPHEQQSSANTNASSRHSPTRLPTPASVGAIDPTSSTQQHLGRRQPNGGAAQLLDAPVVEPQRLFPASNGAYISFTQLGDRWQAAVQYAPNGYARYRALRVVSPSDIGSTLRWLAGQDVWTSRVRIHILSTSQPPYRECVYIGKLGLLGGVVSEDKNVELPAKNKQPTEEDACATTPGEPLYDVFISHVGGDKRSIAVPLCDELALLGVRSFLDKKKLRTGSYAPEDMIQAMETALCGVFILGPEFVAGEWPMKELRCFLRRYEDAKRNKNSTPPLLVPVLHRLTWADCEMDPQAFFSKYKGHFTVEENGFSERTGAKEADVAQITENLQVLRRLKSFAGVECEAYDRQLVYKTTQTVYEVLKKFGFKRSRPSEAPAHCLRNHIGFPVVSHYMSRDLEIRPIHEKLTETGLCVLHGQEGGGKSTLAVQYAKDYSEGQSVIRFVPMVGQYTLIEEFQHLAQEMGKDWKALARSHRDNPRVYHRALGQLVYRSLAEKSQRIFLILDDAQEQHVRAIQDVLLHREQDSVQTIITTSNRKLFQRRYPLVALADFREQEGRAYVSRQLGAMGRGGHVSDVEALLKAVGRMPIQLALAMGYLKAQATRTPSEYIQRLREVHPESGLTAQVAVALKELSVPAQQIMRYSTLLDATAIPLPLLRSLMEQDREQLGAVLTPLVHLSLVRFLPDGQSIQVHQAVQDSCRRYRSWSEGADENEAALLDRLVTVLYELMPWVQSKPDDRWILARLYAPQVTQVLHKALTVLEANIVVASLLAHMGNYQKEIIRNYRQACVYQERALTIYRMLYEEEAHPDIASSLNSVGVAYHQLGEVQKGLSYQEQALAMYQALYGKFPHAHLAMSLSNVGASYDSLGKVQQALNYKKQALEMYQALYGGAPHADVANSFHRVGELYEDLGEIHQGISYQRKALEMYQTLYGDVPHSDIAMSLESIGSAYGKLGEVQTALGYHEKVLAMHQALHPDQNHPDIASSLNNIGAGYNQLDEPEKGLFYQKQSLAMYQALHGEGPHADLAMSLNNVGVSYGELGELRKGVKYQERALLMYQSLYEKMPHADVAMSLNNVGLVYVDIGELSKGLAYQEQALVMHQKLHEEAPHADVAMSLHNVGLTYSKLGNLQESLAHEEQSLAMYQALHGEVPHYDVAVSLHNVAMAYERLDNLQKSLTYEEQSLAMYQALHAGVPHLDVANSLHSLGNAYQRMGELQKGLDCQKQALEAYKELYGEAPHPDVAVSLNNVGMSYHQLGDVQNGLIYDRQSLEMYQALHGEKPHVDIATSLNNVGMAYEKLGQTRKGLTYKEQALSMCQAIYGSALHPDVATSLNNVGLTYGRLGKVKKGLSYQEKALEMSQKLYGDTPHADVARYLNGVGASYYQLGELQKGLIYQKQALEMYQALHGDNPHPNLACSLNNVGVTYEDLNEVQKGLDYQEQSLEMYKRFYGEVPHPELAGSFNNIGVSYDRLGDVQKGRTYFAKALAMRQEIYGDIQHYDLADSLYNMGGACLTLGEVQQAKQYYVEALDLLPTGHVRLKRSICHKLGCTYHIETIYADQMEDRHIYFDKATEAFEAAIAIIDESEVRIVTEYANFLIATEQSPLAYTCLVRTIAIRDNTDELNYSFPQRATVSPILRDYITPGERLVLRAVDYANYLFIYYYEDFVQAGLELEENREVYLNTYAEEVRARAGLPGKERQDEIAQIFLEGLSAEFLDESGRSMVKIRR